MSYIGKRPTVNGIRYQPLAADPSNPLEGQLFYSDGTPRPEGLWVYKNGAWEEAGSTPTTDVNYVTNFGAEADTSGWATYSDAAAVEPVDGTGGSPNVTLTRTTTASELIYGEGTFKLAKDAANRQGQGTSYDIVVQRADYEASNILNISFNYRSSANYVSNDISVFVYDKDGAALVPVRNDNSSGNGAQILAAVDASRFVASFYTTQDNNDYRVIFHVASTNASAYDFFFDNVSVSPQVVVPGAIITPWEAFTPTGSWSTNTTYTGWQRRIGDSLEVIGQIALAGAPTSATLTVNLPTGLVIDAEKLPSSISSSKASLGYGDIRDEGTSNILLSVGYNTTTSVQLYYNDDAADGVRQVSVTQAAPITFANTDRIFYRYIVPISGWSAGASLSTTETLFSTARAQLTGDPASATTGNPIIFPTATYDNFSAYNLSTGLYTVPRSGYYSIGGRIASGNNGTRIDAFVDSSIYAPAGTTDSNGECTLSATVYATKGSTISVRPNGATLDVLTVSTLTIHELPDFSVFSVYGQHEYQESTNSSSGAWPFTVNQFGDHTSLSLTPGEWELCGQVDAHSTGAPGGVVAHFMGISTTSGNSSSGLNKGVNYLEGNITNVSGYSSSLTIARYRVVITTATTYYLKGKLDTTTNMNRHGYMLSARRIK